MSIDPSRVRLQMLRLIAKRLGYKISRNFHGPTRDEKKLAWNLVNIDKVRKAHRDAKRKRRALQVAGVQPTDPPTDAPAHSQETGLQGEESPQRSEQIRATPGVDDTQHVLEAKG